MINFVSQYEIGIRILKPMVEVCGTEKFRIFYCTFVDFTERCFL